eukprot:comp17022_c0_seq1/m.15709 comp17022_c0_seq1/g.15709  ORF comp17022_c0_seq1/g.15709 comp17022_c0_seq1/m.15709 type:complete len:702 (-) comp17022_c0_seq1:169-2274(-)
MASFEYDNEGNTTLVFLLAVVSLYLILATFNRVSALGKKEENVADRLPPEFVKLCQKKDAPRAVKKKSLLTIWNVLYVFGWVVFALLVIKVQSAQLAPMEEFNPYEILGLPEGATEKEIKAAYRKLSRVMHPDKNPESPDANAKYMLIVKAHQTLTDPVTRENWEKYGHPDGRRAESYGVALPSWMVSSEYKWLVLGMYCVALAGGSVGIYFWWRRTSKMGEAQVRQDTMGIYHQLIRSQMSVNDVIEVICAAAEFNEDIPKREIDAQSLPQYVAAIKAKESSLVKYFVSSKVNAEYCMRAKALMFSYLLGIDGDLHPEHQADLADMLSRFPLLLACFLKIAQIKPIQEQQQAREKERQTGRKEKFNPTRNLLPITNALYANQLVVQGVDETRMTPVRQVPHINDDNFKYFVKGKRKITTVEQLLEMSDEDRRSMLRMLSDEEYQELMLVADNLPCVVVTPKVYVLGEDRICAGAVITLKLRLERISQSEWAQRQAAVQVKTEKKKVAPVGNGKLRKRQTNHAAKNDDDVPEDLEEEVPTNSKPLSKGDEEVEWDEDLVKKEKVFKDETHSYPVYCPRWKQEREEAWWVFVSEPVESGPGMIVTEPKKIDNLITDTEVELYLPPVEADKVLQAQKHKVQVWVMSDSYLGLETRQAVEFTVHPAPKEEIHEPEPSGSELDGEGEGEEEDRQSEGSDVESDIE